MAALVTGLIPILRTAVDSTTTYKCRSLWFGFLCIRLVVLFLAELPWFRLDADFSCNATRELVCTRACYNELFNKPVMVTWNFLYVLLVLSVLLMELFSSHLRSMALKKSSPNPGIEMEAMGKTAVQAGAGPPAAKMVIDLHSDKRHVGFYLLSIVLRILVEVLFVYVLLYWNLPTLNETSFKCRSQVCPELHLCLVRAAPEKRMSIYTLVSISGMVIICSVMFCLYSIAHYICNC
ncbi:gap junction beta-3 protein [Aplochiton taeniatus]